MSLYYPLSACNLFKSIEVCQVYILCLYQYNLTFAPKLIILIYLNNFKMFFLLLYIL